MTDSFRMRQNAMELAVDTLKATGNTIPGGVITHAKEIEKYLWGGLEPLPPLVTPLHTIEEIAQVMQKKLDEIANGSDEPTAKLLIAAAAHWERFMCEVNAALGKFRG